MTALQALILVVSVTYQIGWINCVPGPIFPHPHVGTEPSAQYNSEKPDLPPQPSYDTISQTPLHSPPNSPLNSPTTPSGPNSFGGAPPVGPPGQFHHNPNDGHNHGANGAEEGAMDGPPPDYSVTDPKHPGKVEDLPSAAHGANKVTNQKNQKGIFKVNGSINLFFRFFQSLYYDLLRPFGKFGKKIYSGTGKMLSGLSFLVDDGTKKHGKKGVLDIDAPEEGIPQAERDRAKEEFVQALDNAINPHMKKEERAKNFDAIKDYYDEHVDDAHLSPEEKEKQAKWLKNCIPGVVFKGKKLPNIFKDTIEMWLEMKGKTPKDTKKAHTLELTEINETICKGFCKGYEERCVDVVNGRKPSEGQAQSQGQGAQDSNGQGQKQSLWGKMKGLGGSESATPGQPNSTPPSPNGNQYPPNSNTPVQPGPHPGYPQTGQYPPPPGSPPQGTPTFISPEVQGSPPGSLKDQSLGQSPPGQNHPTHLHMQPADQYQHLDQKLQGSTTSGSTHHQPQSPPSAPEPFAASGQTKRQNTNVEY